jgi:hypothetical protein
VDGDRFAERSAEIREASRQGPWAVVPEFVTDGLLGLDTPCRQFGRDAGFG